jgi:hypothetical protein
VCEPVLEDPVALDVGVVVDVFQQLHLSEYNLGSTMRTMRHLGVVSGTPSTVRDRADT